MQSQSVYKSFAQRCGGVARVGVVCPSGELFARAFNEACGEEGIEFCDGAATCNAAVLVLSGPPVGEDAANSLAALVARGLPCAVLCKELPDGLQSDFGSVPCMAIDPASPDKNRLEEALSALLMQFPVERIDIAVPAWVRSLPAENSAVTELMERVRACVKDIEKMCDCTRLSSLLSGSKNWRQDVELELFPHSGRARVAAKICDGAFFNMLSETAGESITDESSLMTFAVSAAQARAEYGKIKDALECARETGYGIVVPSDCDMTLEKPAVVKQGQNVGIRLKAAAPSYHIIKVDVCGEVSPMLGNTVRSEEMVNEIIGGFDSDPQGMWNTNLFGRSLRSMVQEGLNGKTDGMQQDTRIKLRKALTRMVNEGKGGVICILL